MALLSHAWGKVLEAFALAACALLGVMTLMICADVLLRNVALIPGVDALPWSNELSETTLYLVTMLAAPWLLREGRHIRVDIVLRAIPPRASSTKRRPPRSLKINCSIACSAASRRTKRCR